MSFLSKHSRPLMIIDLVVLYMTVMALISSVRAPAALIPVQDEGVLISYSDFSAAASGRLDARVEEDCLILEGSEPSAKVLSVPIPLIDYQGITVSFSLNCPEQYAGTTLHIDLQTDGYDNDAQEHTVTLLPGTNEVSCSLDKGEYAPELANLRIFTLDPAGYELTNLQVYGMRIAERPLIPYICCMVVSGVILLILSVGLFLQKRIDVQE